MIWGESWADVVQAVVAAAGFLFIIYQIHHVRRAMLAAAHDRLEGHYIDVLHILADRPHLRPYFYASAVYEPSSDPAGELRAEIEVVAECILGLIEHASLQRKNLLDDTWESCWLPYAEERLRKSPELRRFLRENRIWYTQGMCDLLASLPDDEPPPKDPKPVA